MQLLPGLKDKAVLKEIGRPILPAPIVVRPKQPYRAPDALCFAGPDAPEWVSEVLAPETLVSSGLFVPDMVHNLRNKLNSFIVNSGPNATPSNADNMAMAGVVSAQLLHEKFVVQPITSGALAVKGWRLMTDVDKSRPDA